MTGTLTYDVIRTLVAESLYLTSDELGDTDDLFAAGLDSVRLIGLLTHWKTYGVVVGFADLAERPTLRDWWLLLMSRPTS
ncbi:phosphopantetheine-binding protein [Nocardia sp. NBC_01499]|uniref:phosphopantetheine-binding protein n=1 Tax=Nocardia sp. NBC_01499 TaxID=2903597 RepID=UPI00386A0965